MVRMAAVELLDGTWLGIDATGADFVFERELALWALVPEPFGGTASPIRAEPEWEDVLAAGALVDAVRTRAVTDEAALAFPGVVRHLSAQWAAERPPLTTEQVIRAVSAVAVAARDTPDERPHRWDPPRWEGAFWSLSSPDGPTATCGHDGLVVTVALTG